MGPVAGALARTGMLSRIPLTPEGIGAQEAIAATDGLLREGAPVLNFSFHSPTLEPGHTPYVREEAERPAFYGGWAAVLAHLAKRNVRPAPPDTFRKEEIGRPPRRERLCQYGWIAVGAVSYTIKQK